MLLVLVCLTSLFHVDLSNEHLNFVFVGKLCHTDLEVGQKFEDLLLVHILHLLVVGSESIDLRLVSNCGLSCVMMEQMLDQIHLLLDKLNVTILHKL